MTLEEAKKKIRNYMKQSKDDYNRFYDDICRGEADAYSHALSILEQVDTEPVGNPDKLTLTELAHELRKIFKFKYLTYNAYGILCIWAGERPKPEYIKDFCFWNFYPERTFTIGSIDTKTKDCVRLDLSEYKDADGNIDYSKCIVEVE